MLSESPFRLLLVEQNPLEVKFIRGLLQAGEHNLEVYDAANAQETIQQLQRMAFDAVLVDGAHPTEQVLNVLLTLKNAQGDLPVVLLIARVELSLQAKAMEMGVHYFLVKSELEAANLSAVLRHAAVRQRLTTRVREEKNVILDKDGHDLQTGLPGRAMAVDRLENTLLHAKRYSQTMALLFIGLDGLKMIGQNYGDAAADAALKTVAEQLHKILRTSDVTGRYGREEFICILNDLSKVEDIELIIDKVGAALSTPLKFQEQELAIKAHIGVAVYPQDGNSPQQLIQHARMAMLGSTHKPLSENRNHSEQALVEDFTRLKMEEAVRMAMSKSELDVHYQPVIAFDSRDIIAADAHLAWRHPEFYRVSSKEFMFLAEASGLIQALEEWLLRKVGEQQQAWHAAGMPEVRMRVPLTSRLLHGNNLTAMVGAVLRETTMSAQALELAVPVSAIMQNPQKAAATLSELQAQGIHIILDEFGGSRTSFDILQTCPIEGVIVDSKIIQKITEDADSRATAKTIIAMGQALRMAITADGVETPTQESLLAAWRCPYVQGDLYSQPVAGRDFFNVLGLQAQDQTVVDKEKYMNVMPIGGGASAERIKVYIEKLNELPPMSHSAQQLLRLRNNPDAGINELSEIIRLDPALAAQIIRYANAPFFGNQGRITTIEQAIMTALGFDGALNMALGVTMLGNLHDSAKGGLNLHAFWQHAVYSAALSQEIAKNMPGRRASPGTAYLAGLLQNIGSLALCQDFPEEIEKVKNAAKAHSEQVITELEEHTIGISHAEIGLRLLRAWQLPEEIIEAVFEHHNIAYVGDHTLYANIVLIANRLLAPYDIGDENLRDLPASILQALSLSEPMLEEIASAVMAGREGLDTMCKYLAA